MQLNDFQHPFFIGIAGTGMSAIAQYMAGIGKNVSGSDRYFTTETINDTRNKLEAEGIQCFLQNGSGISSHTDLVVVSTAIEDTVYEVQKAKELNIPILKRSDVLAMLSDSKKTIAVGGTSGKSTVSAMIFDILQQAGKNPSIISGAGLTSLINKGKIGNAQAGTGEWLVIEADESDGSIVKYHPEIGVLLNIDKDHQEIEELMELFSQFRDNTSEHFITNQSNVLAAGLSSHRNKDFGVANNNTNDTSERSGFVENELQQVKEVDSELQQVGFVGTDFCQEGFTITFTINSTPFTLHAPGRHSMENALAAVAAVHPLGISLEQCAQALANYQGIHRRHQLIAQKEGVIIIDDYAHNPAKCAASIRACHAIAPTVIAWFQPHGYGPTRFLRYDFVKEIANALRPTDEIWMSEIFYAGGTAVKDISANDLVTDIQHLGKNAFFVENRIDLAKNLRSHLTKPCVVLMMGARDPGLENFAREMAADLLR
jgi:UDP-N-acetylmuramate--alanine ligase